MSLLEEDYCFWCGANPRFGWEIFHPGVCSYPIQISSKDYVLVGMLGLWEICR